MVRQVDDPLWNQHGKFIYLTLWLSDPVVLCKKVEMYLTWSSPDNSTLSGMREI